MISTPNESNHDDLNDWEKFSKYLWFDKDISMWLDISKVIFDANEIKRIQENFEVFLKLQTN